MSLSRLTQLPAGRITKWLVLSAWLVLAAVSVPLAGRLSEATVVNDTVELPRGAEATRVVALADRFPDSTVTAGILVYARPGGLTPADLSKVDRDRAAATALAARPVEPARASTDGDALALTVGLHRDDTLTDPAAALRDLARAGLPAGLEVRLTGPAGNALDAGDARERAAGIVMLVTALVVAVVLLVIYRSPTLWLLPLINVGVAFVVTDAVTYLLGRFASMTVSGGNAVIVTVLVFGVGTDYALLVISRYREELRAEPDRHLAMARALRQVTPTLVASAGTVGLGLLCLLTADMGFNFTLGPAGAIGVLCGLLVMVTLLPAQLVILGRWVFWPLIPRAGAATTTRTGMWTRIGRAVAARPRMAWIGTALVLGLLAAGALDLRTGLDDRHLVTGNPDSVAGQTLLAAHFPAGASRPVTVIADAAAAAPVAAAARAVPGVASVNVPVYSVDGAIVRLDVTITDPVDSPAAVATVAAIRAEVRQVPAADALVGGYTAMNTAKTDAQAHDRRVVIPLVLAVVLAILILLLRSLLAPLLLIATVVLSYLAALGASWLLFVHAFGFPAVDVQVMLIGFLFLAALGADYNIFLMSRARQEARLHGHRDGVLRALTSTGGVITGAGLVLAATFAVLVTTPQIAFIEIGFMVALGVLLDTVVVRAVLVPALALDIGSRFWWPGRPAPHPQSPDAPVHREPAGLSQ